MTTPATFFEYAAGTSGTATVPSGYSVTGIACHASGASAYRIDAS